MIRILVIHFSFTSRVRQLAGEISEELEKTGEVTRAVIQPLAQRSVRSWLARSFIPGWREPIRPTIVDQTSYDLVCLGSPKWTFNCPPVSEYIHQMQCRADQPLAIFMSFGGFDQERYLKSLVRKVGRRGARVVATLAVRRAAVQRGDYRQDLLEFCRRAVAQVRH